MYGDARPLFVVTEVVIVGLIIFVGFVLLKMKEPWVRNQSLAVSALEPAAVTVVPAVTAADDKVDAESEKEALRDQDDKPKND